MKKENRDIEKLSRVITLGEINSESANEVIRAIYEINMEDYDVKSENREFIQLILNSPGGDVYDGFAIVDAIQHSGTPIQATILGRAMSMGLVIAAVCHYRVSGPNARFMYHEGVYGVEGSGRVHKNEFVEYELMEKKYDTILIENSKLSEEQLEQEKQKAKEWYFGAIEAKELGIVDSIIGEEVE